MKKKLNMAKVNKAAEKIAIKLIEDGYELNDMNFVCDQSACECADATEVPEVNLTVIVADKVDDEYAADVAAAADLPCVDSYCDGLALSGEGEEGVSKIALANEEDPLMPPSIATYIECKLGAEYFNVLTEAEEKAEAKVAAKQRYKSKAENEPTTVEKPRKTKEIADEADATAKSRISKLNYGDMDKYARSNTPSNPKVRTFRTNADYKKVEESKLVKHWNQRLQEVGRPLSSFEDIENAAWDSNTISGDYAELEIEYESGYRKHFTKIGKNKWHHNSNSAHGLGGNSTNEEIWELTHKGDVAKVTIFESAKINEEYEGSDYLINFAWNTGIDFDESSLDSCNDAIYHISKNLYVRETGPNEVGLFATAGIEPPEHIRVKALRAFLNYFCDLATEEEVIERAEESEWNVAYCTVEE